MICTCCGNYFKKNKNVRDNQTECESCVDLLYKEEYDPEIDLEVEYLTNPTGKTQPVFYD